MKTTNSTIEKRFHVTWFIDQKKTILAGSTVAAKDISDAVSVVLKSKEIETMNESPIEISVIKYVMEL